jgi:hypothetical protein
MLNFRRSDLSLSFTVPGASRSLITRLSDRAQKSRARRGSQLNCPESLEIRRLLAADLSATLVNGLLTVSDTNVSGDDNVLTVTVNGTDLVISDAHQQFMAAPAGGSLSVDGQTLTIPVGLVTSGLTINAGLGDDQIDIGAIDPAFDANLTVNGDGGNDTVTFGGAANLGSGSVTVAAETIAINSALTAGGAINLTSTGDDTLLSVNAVVIAGADSTFTSDKMDIENTVNVGSNTLKLVPESTIDAGDSIDIGSTSDTEANTLQLSDHELDQITAGTIVIGDANTGTISVTGNIQHASDSNFQIMTGRNIAFSLGSSWATHNGNLSLIANSSGTTNGNFFGIDVDQSTISSSGMGNILLNGQGGNGGVNKLGIFAHGGSVIQSTGTGQISLTGTGGLGTSDARGIQVNDASITSVAGEIRLTGQGGADSAQANIGVWLVSGATVTATGTARITIDGTGSGGTSDNTGVELNGFGYFGATHITAQDGDITITGHGSTSAVGPGSRGIAVLEGAQIQSTGQGKITLNGTAGTGADADRGVEIGDTGTQISTAAGDIQITGQGGTGIYAFGVWVRSSAVVQSTGVGKIYLDGTGGTDGYDNTGVVLNGYSNGGATRIVSLDGDITITGHGSSLPTGTNSRGIGVYDAAAIQSTGLAKITLNGTGGSAGDPTAAANLTRTDVGEFEGIDLGNGMIRSSGAGDITLIGQGGNVGVNNLGIFAHGGSVIESTGTGQISLTGTGGLGTSDARGIQVNDASITSVAGEIRFTGHGGADSAQANIGVWLVSGATVTATGTARITIDGTGSGGTSDNTGVELNGFGYFGATHITAEDGDITITGHGSTSAVGPGSRGIAVLEGAQIQSTGQGKITLNGTAGTGADADRGVEIGDTGTQITASAGDIQITGQGGTGIYAFGVWVRSGAVVQSTDSGKLTIQGTAGLGGGEETGVVLNGYSTGGLTRIQSLNGDITITGIGGNSVTGSGDRGIGIYDGAQVISTGTARITLDGTAGTGVDTERGVEIGDADTKITSAQGAISITGRGGVGSSVSGTYDLGVWIRDSAVVESTATTGTAATITLNGSGGAGAGADIGVWITGAAKVSSIVGDVSVIGHGASGIGIYNFGVDLQSGGTIASTGTAKVTIDGTGGNGAAQGQGVFVEQNSRIQSLNGDIQVTGHAGSGGDFNLGVGVQSGSVIESLGIARININGTGGQGTDSNEGVRVFEAGSAIRSVTGDIVITGQAGSGTGIFEHGVDVENGGKVISTGAAKITVNGNSSVSAGRSAGVYVVGTDAAIQSLNGDIQITGTGGSVGESNIGVSLQEGGSIESTGTAKISLNGTGGQGTAGTNHGVRIYGADAFIRSAVGDISVVGVGGVGGTGTVFNSGVDLQLGGAIISTGTARINVTGTGGTGIFSADSGVGQVGVWVLNATSNITSKYGDIQITGIGGGDLGSSGNHGVVLQSGTISTSAGGTANVLITGTAGVGPDGFGINVNSDSATVGIDTSAGTGNITLVSDGLNIDSVSQPGKINAGTQTVTIHPHTAGSAINLGGVDTNGMLGITDAELDRVFAGALNVGDNSSGSISVTSNITRTVSTNMRLTTAGDVLLSGGLINTGGGSLLLDPGASPHSVQTVQAGVDATANTVTLGGDLAIAINGTVVDSGYTQLNIQGNVNLSGMKLVLSGGYTPTIGDSFVVVTGTGIVPVTGTFNCLAEGSLIHFNGRTLQITYAGGVTGHDVVLTAVNQAPVTVGANLTVDEDTVGSGVLVATDVDSPALTYSIVGNASHGTVTITNTATGAYTYTPTLNYNGPDSFTFKTNDGLVESNTSTVSIIVNSVNDAPQLSLQGGPVTFSAKAARKGGPTQVVPNVTVVDPDQSAGFGVGGRTLTISLDASGKQTRKGAKLNDKIGGLTVSAGLGTAAAPTFSNGKLQLTVHLSANATASDVQTFLRGITFSTKGAGLKLTHRAFQVQLTDAAGAASNVLVQTVNVTK